MRDSSRVLALVNSRLERPAETEEFLPDATAAARWLADQFTERAEASAAGGGDSSTGTSGTAPRLTDDDYESMLRLREALRRLMLDRITAREPDRTSLEVLNRVAAHVVRTDRLTPAWSRECVYSAPAGSEHAPTSRLAILATEAITMLSDPHTVLAECAAEDCVVLFERLDPRRRWHSDRCGNRIRAARSYARNHQTTDA